jgi:cell division protein ZapA (FtsZ GTPase activity inhibitor)
MHVIYLASTKNLTIKTIIEANAATTETTHVYASFTLQPITFCEDSSKVDTSPITISSSAKDKSKVFTNQRVLQDNQVEKAKEEEKKVGTVNTEETEEHLEVYAKLDKRVKTLEEGFFTFSKFSLKVTHAIATTLQLLAQEKEETRMDMEDHKFLFKFLADDWALVMLAAKGKERTENHVS